MELSLADELLKGYEGVFTVQVDFGTGIRTYPVWKLIERLLYIVDKEGNKIRFRLNLPQIKLYKAMCEQKKSGIPVREDILKARQLGYSTFIAGFFFIYTMFTPNFKSGVMADISDHAHNIFAKYQYFYDHLDDSNPNYEAIRKFELEHKGQRSPLSWKPALKSSRGQEYMQTLKGNSILEVLVAGASSGRSGTYQALHLSECAFFDNLRITMNGALETVSDKAINSLVFLETTANGFNEYKDRWDKDASGNSRWEAFFMPWFDNPDYQRPLLEGQKMPIMEDWLLDRQREFNLTDAQMNWYYGKLQDKGDKMLMLQEYPFCPTDAFVSSGDCFFKSDLVANAKENAIRNKPIYRGIYMPKPHFNEDGDYITLTNTDMVIKSLGAWRVYEEPQKGHPYVVVCDPNNERNDDSAIHIIDNSTCRQVACFSSSDYPLDQIAYQIACAGYNYNDALVSVEMNAGGGGLTVMDYLINLHYENLAINKRLSAVDYRESASRSFGHEMTKATRPFALENFKIAFSEDPNMVKDYETLCEMESFQRVRHVARNGTVTKKSEAVAGSHDDLVMAYAGFYLVRDQITTLVNQEKANEEKEMPIWALERLIEERRNGNSNDFISKSSSVTGIDL